MVTICDVGPRDGLQSQPQTLAPAVRAELCNRLAAAGLPAWRRSASSAPSACRRWTAPRRSSPSLERRPGVVFAGLVLNERGYERLAAAGLAEAHLTVAVSESFSRENANASVEEAAAAAERDSRARTRGRDPRHGHAQHGLRLPVRGSGRPGPGARARGPPRRGRRRRGRLRRHDRRRRAAPGQGAASRASTDLGVPVGVHLHNTRNTGFANAYAALEAGATVFDASIGGIGGCPFAPRATGNIATEDLVYLLHGEGVETGVDLGALIGVSEWLESVLGRELEGQVYRAGLS